jgi:hypothetical protein
MVLPQAMLSPMRAAALPFIFTEPLPELMLLG